MEPWLSTLTAGNAHAAWELFVARYRRLIVATIKRLVTDHDDVMDVFSVVCDALVADDFARLRSYADRAERRASVATWLVAVVRNLTIDWLRRRDGRPRFTVPATLTPLQQQIYAAICGDGRSHVEAYETIRARTGSAMPFHEFLREVRATQRTAPCPGDSAHRGRSHVSLPDDEAIEAPDPVETAESARRIADALSSQPDDVRLAVELFVVDRLPAAEVARTVGWRDAKAVYNRVYRALAALRAEFTSKGIGPRDL